MDATRDIESWAKQRREGLSVGLWKGIEVKWNHGKMACLEWPSSAVLLQCRQSSASSTITRGGILGVRWGDIWLISSSTLPGLGRVSAKHSNKLTDFNAAVSSPDYHPNFSTVTKPQSTFLRLSYLGLFGSAVSRSELVAAAAAIKAARGQLLRRNEIRNGSGGAEVLALNHESRII